MGRPPNRRSTIHTPADVDNAKEKELLKMPKPIGDHLQTNNQTKNNTDENKTEIVMNVNQRPRRQIVHKYIKTTSQNIQPLEVRTSISSSPSSSSSSPIAPASSSSSSPVSQPQSTTVKIVQPKLSTKDSLLNIRTPSPTQTQIAVRRGRPPLRTPSPQDITIIPTRVSKERRSTYISAVKTTSENIVHPAKPQPPTLQPSSPKADIVLLRGRLSQRTPSPPRVSPTSSVAKGRRSTYIPVSTKTCDVQLRQQSECSQQKSTPTTKETPFLLLSSTKITQSVVPLRRGRPPARSSPPEEEDCLASRLLKERKSSYIPNVNIPKEANSRSSTPAAIQITPMQKDRLPAARTPSPPRSSIITCRAPRERRSTYMPSSNVEISVSMRSPPPPPPVPLLATKEQRSCKPTTVVGIIPNNGARTLSSSTLSIDQSFNSIPLLNSDVSDNKICSSPPESPVIRRGRPRTSLQRIVSPVALPLSTPSPPQSPIELLLSPNITTPSSILLTQDNPIEMMKTRRGRPPTRFLRDVSPIIGKDTTTFSNSDHTTDKISMNLKNIEKDKDTIMKHCYTINNINVEQPTITLIKCDNDLTKNKIQCIKSSTTTATTTTTTTTTATVPPLTILNKYHESSTISKIDTKKIEMKMNKKEFEPNNLRRSKRLYSTINTMDEGGANTFSDSDSDPIKSYDENNSEDSIISVIQIMDDENSNENTNDYRKTSVTIHHEDTVETFDLVEIDDSSLTSNDDTLTNNPAENHNVDESSILTLIEQPNDDEDEDEDNEVARTTNETNSEIIVIDDSDSEPSTITNVSTSNSKIVFNDDSLDEQNKLSSQSKNPITNKLINLRQSPRIRNLSKYTNDCNGIIKSTGDVIQNDISCTPDNGHRLENVLTKSVDQTETSSNIELHQYEITQQRTVVECHENSIVNNNLENVSNKNDSMNKTTQIRGARRKKSSIPFESKPNKNHPIKDTNSEINLNPTVMNIDNTNNEMLIKATKIMDKIESEETVKNDTYNIANNRRGSFKPDGKPKTKKRNNTFDSKIICKENVNKITLENNHFLSVANVTHGNANPESENFELNKIENDRNFTKCTSEYKIKNPSVIQSNFVVPIENESNRDENENRQIENESNLVLCKNNDVIDLTEENNSIESNSTNLAVAIVQTEHSNDIAEDNCEVVSKINGTNANTTATLNESIPIQLSPVYDDDQLKNSESTELSVKQTSDELDQSTSLMVDQSPSNKETNLQIGNKLNAPSDSLITPNNDNEKHLLPHKSSKTHSKSSRDEHHRKHHHHHHHHHHHRSTSSSSSSSKCTEREKDKQRKSSEDRSKHERCRSNDKSSASSSRNSLTNHQSESVNHNSNREQSPKRDKKHAASDLKTPEHCLMTPKNKISDNLSIVPQKSYKNIANVLSITPISEANSSSHTQTSSSQSSIPSVTSCITPKCLDIRSSKRNKSMYIESPSTPPTHITLSKFATEHPLKGIKPIETSTPIESKKTNRFCVELKSKPISKRRFTTLQPNDIKCLNNNIEKHSVIEKLNVSKVSSHLSNGGDKQKAIDNNNRNPVQNNVIAKLRKTRSTSCYYERLEIENKTSSSPHSNGTGSIQGKTSLNIENEKNIVSKKSFTDALKTLSILPIVDGPARTSHKLPSSTSVTVTETTDSLILSPSECNSETSSSKTNDDHSHKTLTNTNSTQTLTTPQSSPFKRSSRWDCMTKDADRQTDNNQLQSIHSSAAISSTNNFILKNQSSSTLITKAMLKMIDLPAIDKTDLDGSDPSISCESPKFNRVQENKCIIINNYIDGKKFIDLNKTECKLNISEPKNGIIQSNNENEPMQNLKRPPTPSIPTQQQDEDDEEEIGIRRSGRIRTKAQRKSHGLVRDKERLQMLMLNADNSVNHEDQLSQVVMNCEPPTDAEIKDRLDALKLFTSIQDNDFRYYSKERSYNKDTKNMICDCFLTQSEIDNGEFGCGEDCLNRYLMIECGDECVVDDRCTNKRFQKYQYSECVVFRTDKKGYGIKAVKTIEDGEFIMEYVGEVLNGRQFEKRASDYDRDKNKHCYFMALRSDCIIDATGKGNISRFINHSCDPNAATQKWTVNGELRIGFFTIRKILPNEEITFDYQFQRFGKEAQRCYCESYNCRGWIGGEPDEDSSDSSGGDSELDEDLEESIQLTELDETIKDNNDLQKSNLLDKTTKDHDHDNDEIDLENRLKSKYSWMTDDKTMENSENIDAANKIMNKKKLPKVKVNKVSKALKSLKKKKIITDIRNESMQDHDLDKEIDELKKSNLKNQAQTLKFSRLVVRAKSQITRSQLLYILRMAELPCRRLFLDYHGLKFLYSWMCAALCGKNYKSELEFIIELLETLELLPIPNKTMLKESKVLETAEKWSNFSINSITMNLDNVSTTQTTDTNELNDLITKICSLANRLCKHWETLREVFRIPKKLRIEQMKEHEREADRNYKDTIVEDKSQMNKTILSSAASSNSRYNRYIDRNAIDRADRLDRHWDRERTIRHRRKSYDGPSPIVPLPMNSIIDTNNGHLTKHERRQLFEAKVAQEALELNEKRNKEKITHEAMCEFFGLDKATVSKSDRPFYVDSTTGQWYSTEGHKISKPPSHAHIKPPEQTKSTDPNDYLLPSMDLPDYWQFAIDTKGRLFYYHTKIRIPQWDPPIKFKPLIEELKTNADGSSLIKKDSQLNSNNNNNNEELKCSDDDDNDNADEDDADADFADADHDDNDDDMEGDMDYDENYDINSSTTDTSDTSEDELKMKLYDINQKRRMALPTNTSLLEIDMLKKPPNLAEEISALGKPSSIDNNSETMNLISQSTRTQFQDPLSIKIPQSDDVFKKRKKYRPNLVQEYIISPRTEEERYELKLVGRRYKENKEKLRRRKEEAKRRKLEPPVSRKFSKLMEGLPIVNNDADDLDSDDEDTSEQTDLLKKLTSAGTMVDELDIRRREKESNKQKHLENVHKHKLKHKSISNSSSSGHNSHNQKNLNNNSNTNVTNSGGSGGNNNTSNNNISSNGAAILNSSSAKRRAEAKEKFRAEVSGVIVMYLQPFFKGSCTIGRITNNDDFKHLARKLTNFVLIKELKHCDITKSKLEVNDSVKAKAKEFIKKYMSKFGPTYIKPENEAEIKD